MQAARDPDPGLRDASRSLVLSRAVPGAERPLAFLLAALQQACSARPGPRSGFAPRSLSSRKAFPRLVRRPPSAAGTPDARARRGAARRQGGDRELAALALGALGNAAVSDAQRARAMAVVEARLAPDHGGRSRWESDGDTQAAALEALLALSTADGSAQAVQARLAVQCCRAICARTGTDALRARATAVLARLRAAGAPLAGVEAQLVVALDAAHPHPHPPLARRAAAAALGAAGARGSLVLSIALGRALGDDPDASTRLAAARALLLTAGELHRGREGAAEPEGAGGEGVRARVLRAAEWEPDRRVRRAMLALLEPLDADAELRWGGLSQAGRGGEDGREHEDGDEGEGAGSPGLGAEEGAEVPAGSPGGREGAAADATEEGVSGGQADPGSHDAGGGGAAGERGEGEAGGGKAARAHCVVPPLALVGRRPRSFSRLGRGWDKSL